MAPTPPAPPRLRAAAARAAWIAATAAVAAGGCATPQRNPARPAPAAGGRPAATAPARPDAAAADARLARLRLRASWPSEADRARWDGLLARADGARAAADAASLDAALFDLEQLDGILRVGEAARRR